MVRFAKILALMLVIGLLAAPSALAKPLQPTLPPDARSAPAAQSSVDSDDVSTLAAGSGIAVVLVGLAMYTLGRRRCMPALP
jgi:hypothetical protein